MQAFTLVLQRINRGTVQGAAVKSLLSVSYVVTVKGSSSLGSRLCNTATIRQREEFVDHWSSTSHLSTISFVSLYKDFMTLHLCVTGSHCFERK